MMQMETRRLQKAPNELKWQNNQNNVFSDANIEVDIWRNGHILKQFVNNRSTLKVNYKLLYANDKNNLPYRSCLKYSFRVGVEGVEQI